MMVDILAFNIMMDICFLASANEKTKNIIITKLFFDTGVEAMDARPARGRILQESVRPMPDGRRTITA